MPLKGSFKTSFPTARRCRSCECDGRLSGGVNGSWVSPLQWRPGGCEKSATMSRVEAHTCLQKTPLIFAGNSMTRQMFLRLIWWLRGFDGVWDHYIHQDAIYTKSRFDDELRWSPSLANELLALRKAVAEEDMKVLFFLQAGLGSSNPEIMTLAKQGKAAVIRGEFGRFTVFWDGNEEKLSLDTMNDCAGAPHYFRRNILRVATSAGPRSLPLDPIGAQRKWDIPGGWTTRLKWRKANLTADDDAHFQCGVEPMFPKCPSAWKMPLNGDCRDILNLNAVLAMLKRVCRKS